MKRPIIQIKLGSRLTITGLPADLEEWCQEENTFQNPKHYMLRAMGRPYKRVPRLILLAKYDRLGQLTLPRGFKRQLIKNLRQHKVPFHVTDKTVCPHTDLLRHSHIKLCGYQRREIATMLRSVYGVVQAPTGSGKTNIILGLAGQLQTRLLILVHTRRIFNQTCRRIRNELKIEPGVIQGSTLRLRTVTVAMVQTLSRRNLKELGIADYFGAVLVDEAHHSPATTWARILDQMPARYRFGVTATAWRKDKMEFLLWRLIGPLIGRVSRREAESAGRIIWPHRIEIATDFTSEYGATEWTSLLSQLTTDVQRNRRIAATVRRYLQKAHRGLVLTDRVKHAEILAVMLKDFHPALLTGNVAKVEQEKIMDRVRKGARLTVATTGMLGEGVDVPGWDILFLATPAAAGPRVLQNIGRVTRPAPGKMRALVVDFVDEQVDSLLRAAGSRARLYRDSD